MPSMLLGKKKLVSASESHFIDPTSSEPARKQTIKWTHGTQAFHELALRCHIKNLLNGEEVKILYISGKFSLLQVFISEGFIFSQGKKKIILICLTENTPFEIG